MTEESDDWFERALAESASGADGEDAEATDDADAERGPTGEHAEVTEGDDEDAEVTEGDDEDAEATDADGSDVKATTGGDEAGGDGLFDESFGDALENAGGPGGAAPDALASDSDAPPGFEDLDFELDPGTETTFEDDEIDSSLPRIDLGIEGLDRMIQGGIPERSLLVAIGSAGTGKTTFGLQFLDRGLSQGERAVFITLEETRRRIIDSATEKGMPFDEYADDGRLAVIDVDPVEMANSLTSIQNELPRLIEEFGASRLVLDSVSLLEMMYEDRAKRRNEIFDFTQSLKNAGVTAMLTSEAAEETSYASRYGIVEYLTDAVFVLQYVRPDDFRETRLAVEIQKIRDANHSREKKPYEITDEGISVHEQANLF